MTDDKITDFHLKICQLDFGDFKNLDVLDGAIGLYVAPKKLTLRHFRHIDNWKILHKFFDIEEIHFDNCKINIESNKKNGWFDIMSRFYYNSFDEYFKLKKIGIEFQLNLLSPFGSLRVI